MKKVICAVICLMMLATFITTACAVETQFSYTLMSRSVTLRAPAKAGYRARVSGTLNVIFRRADYLPNGGSRYSITSRKTSAFGKVGQASPRIEISISARNPADAFISARVSGSYFYTK